MQQTEEITRMYFQQYQQDSIARPALAAYEEIASVLFSTLKPSTALDVGCGGGALIHGLLKHTVDAVGIEGSQHACDLLPDRISLHDLREPYETARKYDLVTCFDVAEHLPAEAAQTLVTSIIEATDMHGWVVFGAAPQGQDGLGHVNCRHPAYWIGKFQPRMHMIPGVSETIREEIESQPGTNHLWWVAKNLMAFTRTTFVGGFKL